MYLYYDSKGTLKEIVNDKAIRAGNSNINKINFFIEGADPQVVNNTYKALTFTSGFRTFIDVENNSLTTEAFSLTTHKDQIPFNKKRELKFFKYFTDYEFFQITVPDDILNEPGTVGCRIQMVTDEGEENLEALDSDDTILTLGFIAFNVEFTGGKAIIEPDTAINIAQWNYLVKLIANEPEGYVPYSGAIQDVDLGEHDLKADEIYLYDGSNESYVKVSFDDVIFKVESPDVGFFAISGYDKYIELEDSDNDRYVYRFPASSGTIALIENLRAGDSPLGYATVNSDGVFSATVATANLKSMLIFTIGNCFVMLPTKGLTDNTYYYAAGAYIKGDGGKSLGLYKYKLTASGSNTTIEIYIVTDNTDYKLAPNYVGYLFSVL